MICKAAATVLEQNALIVHFYNFICSVSQIFLNNWKELMGRSTQLFLTPLNDLNF
jgi:hypothetical protein